MLSRLTLSALLCLLAAVLSNCALAAAEEPIDPDVLRKVRKLIKLTLSEDTAEREKGWNDIREMGNLVTPGLVELCKLPETTPAMTQSILIALGDSKDPRAAPALIELLKSPAAAVRKGAARSLGDCRCKEALPALDLISQNEKEDEDVRLFAAVAGAKLGGPNGLAVLNVLLKSPKAEVRSRAVFALGKHGGIKQVEAIEAALADTEDSVREDAIEALRLLKEKRAWAGLIKATKDENFRIRGNAMNALRELTGQKFDEPKEWQAWWEKHKDDPEAKAPAKKDPKEKKERLKESF